MDIDQKIISFFAQNKIHIEITKKINSYRIKTYYLKLIDFDFKLINKIDKLQKNICLFLNIDNINIKIDNITGCLLLEIPNNDTNIFKYSELIKDYTKQDDGLYCNIGIDTENNIKNIDLCILPHLLIAGTTGSGKSVLVNTIILQLLEHYTPQELELILIDIKQVEFSIYNNIPHLLYNPIVTLENARKILEKTIDNMQERYTIIKNCNCRNIKEYNTKNINNKMKYKLIVIDELAELFLLEKNTLKANLEGYNKIDNYICRIAQLGRACGIHLIIATQRPSSDIISGLIKSNIPSKIALSVASVTNSRIILDEAGAERLTGCGDYLLKVIGTNKIERLQAGFIDNCELEKRIETIINTYNYNNMIKEIEKRNILKELENFLNDCYNKSELKYKCRQELFKKENIDEIIKEIAQNEQEQLELKNNYFKILNNVTMFYKGYIEQEKETIKQEQKAIKEKEKQEKIKRRDKILSLHILTRWLK